MEFLKECATNKREALLKETLKTICIIELNLNSCPDRFAIEDYSDYEEASLASLLHVNAFHNTITSCNNARTYVKH